MISPDETQRKLNARALPDAVRVLRQFSQAEARLLGSVNYCFFPSPLEQPAQSTEAVDAKSRPALRFIGTSR
jgi:hypothetical protein